MSKAEKWSNGSFDLEELSELSELEDLTDIPTMIFDSAKENSKEDNESNKKKGIFHFFEIKK